MLVQVKKWGNSAAIRIPQRLMEQWGARIDGYIDLRDVAAVPDHIDLGDFPFIHDPEAPSLEEVRRAWARDRGTP